LFSRSSSVTVTFFDSSIESAIVESSMPSPLQHRQSAHY
jgi:hypothetical protein